MTLQRNPSQGPEPDEDSNGGADRIPKTGWQPGRDEFPIRSYDPSLPLQVIKGATWLAGASLSLTFVALLMGALNVDGALIMLSVTFEPCVALLAATVGYHVGSSHRA